MFFVSLCDRLSFVPKERTKGSFWKHPLCDIRFLVIKLVTYEIFPFVLRWLLLLFLYTKKECSWYSKYYLIQVLPIGLKYLCYRANKIAFFSIECIVSDNGNIIIKIYWGLSCHDKRETFFYCWASV